MLAQRDWKQSTGLGAGGPAVSTAGPLVLVVEDEEPMRKFLRSVLEDHGFRTVLATHGGEALAHASAYNPDLVLLDLGLPGYDGIEVTRRLREWMGAPIVIISARGQEGDKIAALDVGANDYVTKPFATGELLARIRVWMRQASLADCDHDDSVIAVGKLKIDLARRLVSVADRRVHLTPTEYKLFALLMRNAGRVMTHRQLLEATWGPAYAAETQYVRVYMGHLRQKLEDTPARPRHLVTEPGVGYRLQVD
jgi:two-component system, OmpR family, KDP operon response regulator KdpE